MQDKELDKEKARWLTSGYENMRAEVVRYAELVRSLVNWRVCRSPALCLPFANWQIRRHSSLGSSTEKSGVAFVRPFFGLCLTMMDASLDKELCTLMGLPMTVAQMLTQQQVDSYFREEHNRGRIAMRADH